MSATTGQQTQETTTEQTATSQEATAERQAQEITTEQQTTETTETTTKPVVYIDFKPPEGVKDMDPVITGAFSAKAAALGLTQEQAQGIIDAVAPVMDKQALARRDAMLTTYAETVKADPELGGVNYDKNLGIAQRALNTFATPELKALLEQGMGSHPEVMRMLLRIGKGMREDILVKPDANNANAQHRADKDATLRNMYPSMYKD